jgi:hypothetical protein
MLLFFELQDIKSHCNGIVYGMKQTNIPTTCDDTG